MTVRATECGSDAKDCLRRHGVCLGVLCVGRTSSTGVEEDNQGVRGHSSARLFSHLPLKTSNWIYIQVSFATLLITMAAIPLQVHPHFNPEEAAAAASEFVASLDNLPGEVNFLLLEIKEKDERISRRSVHVSH